MTNLFSFAIALRRAYDSEPPEEKALFFHETGIFSPLGKPDGLYVFINQPVQPVTIRCPGYLEVQIEPQFQKISFCTLFPRPGYVPPSGWKAYPGKGLPGEYAWKDPGCNLRLLSWDAGRNAAQIRSRPWIQGGILRFSKGNETCPALILEKQPPDLFFIGDLPWTPDPGPVERVWMAKTDSSGNYAIVLPEGFFPEQPERERGNHHWVWQR